MVEAKVPEVPVDVMEKAARALVAEHRKIWPGGGWPALREAIQMAQAVQATIEEHSTVHQVNSELREALEKTTRALVIHIFSPLRHGTAQDRDTCGVCGKSFRDDAHLRASEGHPSDVMREAGREARALLERTKP